MLYFSGEAAGVSPSVFEFGGFRLDCGRFELLRDGRSLRLEHKPMELLILLAGSEGRVVTRAEIAKRLWSSDVFVDTEHGINTAIRKIRYILRDDPDSLRFIQTVPAMGYRFVVSVTHLNPERIEIENVAPSSPAISTDSPAPRIPDSLPVGAQPQPESPIAVIGNQNNQRRFWIAIGIVAVLLVATAISVGPKPLVSRLLNRNAHPPITSIAVLPLDNLSGDSSQEYFADGITDELITMLAKESNLRVVSRTSVMQYKNARRPLPEIARALHVDGILEGSVSRTNDHVHLTLQLIRADTDAHFWANSYDRTPNDAATLPGEAAREIATGSTAPCLDELPHATWIRPLMTPTFMDSFFGTRSRTKKQAAIS